MAGIIYNRGLQSYEKERASGKLKALNGRCFTGFYKLETNRFLGLNTFYYNQLKITFFLLI